MSTLSAERCIACRRDSPRVTEAEIADLRREVPDWRLLERDRIARLERVFHFPSFAGAQPSPTGLVPSPRRRVTIVGDHQRARKSG